MKITPKNKKRFRVMLVVEAESERPESDLQRWIKSLYDKYEYRTVTSLAKVVFCSIKEER
jgi:hypothetical protein